MDRRDKDRLVQLQQGRTREGELDTLRGSLELRLERYRHGVRFDGVDVWQYWGASDTARGLTSGVRCAAGPHDAMRSRWGREENVRVVKFTDGLWQSLTALEAGLNTLAGRLDELLRSDVKTLEAPRLAALTEEPV